MGGVPPGDQACRPRRPRAAATSTTAHPRRRRPRSASATRRDVASSATAAATLTILMPRRSSHSSSPTSPASLRRTLHPRPRSAWPRHAETSLGLQARRKPLHAGHPVSVSSALRAYIVPTRCGRAKNPPAARASSGGPRPRAASGPPADATDLCASRPRVVAGLRLAASMAVRTPTGHRQQTPTPRSPYVAASHSAKPTAACSVRVGRRAELVSRPAAEAVPRSTAGSRPSGGTSACAART